MKNKNRWPLSLWALLTSLLLLSGCTEKAKKITFTAAIESVSESGIMVTTTDDTGFDRASVSFDKSLEIPFNLIPGQTVELTILPQIRESYPVQVTAVDIQLISEGQAAEYKTITAEQAAEMMTGDVIVLDVRTQEEYDEGHIEGAVLIPDTEIKDRAESELSDKNAIILVYCRSGRRSKLAAQDLADMGYTNVYEFGGILDWLAERSGG